MQELYVSARESLNEKDKNSVQILADIETSAWFRILNNELVTYQRNFDNQLVACDKYPKDQFINAALYLYENRDSEAAILYALESNTSVKIYGPNGEGSSRSRARGVVLEMSVLKIMSVFETAFLINHLKS